MSSLKKKKKSWPKYFYTKYHIILSSLLPGKFQLCLFSTCHLIRGWFLLHKNHRIRYVGATINLCNSTARKLYYSLKRIHLFLQFLIWTRYLGYTSEGNKAPYLGRAYVVVFLVNSLALALKTISFPYNFSTTLTHWAYVLDHYSVMKSQETGTYKRSKTTA